METDTAKVSTTCQRCSHWVKTGLNVGDCRRFPPTVVLLPTPNGQLIRATAYPERKADDAKCGEYDPKFTFRPQ